jgi:hypothetical protein
MEMLEKHVSKELLDQVQICTSIPGKVPIDPNIGRRTLGTNPTYKNFLLIKKDMTNMIGTYLIVIGITKSLDMLLIFLLKNV